MSTVYLYPVWVRLWHLVNAVLCLLLIASGISLQYSDPAYPLIRFDIAVSIHNVAGILLTLSYLVVLAGNRFTKNGEYYRLKWKQLKKEMPRQAYYYMFGIFRGEKAPYPINGERKFNPLQKIAYVSVIYFMMPLIFITGWALIFPEVIFVKQIFGTSGIHFTDLIHIIAGFVISLFMCVHIYLCTIGKPAGSHFRAMLSGWHHSEDH